LEIEMKASIEKRGVDLKLDMSNEDFDLIFHGIGKTSIHSRVVSGMSREEAYAIDRLYRALRQALPKGDEA
jgi:hypothetical protein